jgi:RsiW-degrading membrane proteinase PrsW (M82 family)
MGLIVSAIVSFGGALLFAYILYWLDRYEKEPLLLLGGVFLWGVIVAAGSAFIINTVMTIGIYVFTGSDIAAELGTGSLIAPIVEESLKGLAVLVVFLVFRREFDSVLDGIIYAGVTALGFAATENTYYILTYGYNETGWSGLMHLAWIRIGLVGWQHPFYTAFTGIGLALARMNRSWFVKILAPILGLSLAMFTHAFHNTAAIFVPRWVLAIFDWSGWLFMFLVIIVATYFEQRNLRGQLWPEVQAGVISQAHYHTASSAWLQLFARLGAIFSGRFFKTARFYQVCGELAHKKQQAVNLGDEQGNSAIIQKLRGELASLRRYV